MKTRVLGLAGAALGLALAYSAPAFADPIDITDPVLLAHYTLTYGDFNIVSLQFAEEATGNKAYDVQSSPGQLHESIVVGSSPGTGFVNGTTGAASSLAGTDAPYNTENGSSITYFATGNPTSAPDPGGAPEFAGDTSTTWDIRVSALQNFLGAGNAPVFYFNLNEQGTDDGLSNTDLLIWVKMTLTSSTGAPTQDFYVAGNPLDPNAPSGKQLSILNGGPDATATWNDIDTSIEPGERFDPDDRRWTVVHGNICVNGENFLHYNACDGSEDAGSETIKQNVGAQQAAFAGYSNALNTALLSGNYDVLHIDWRMAAQDNGYEQLFILASGQEPPVIVPEPLTLTMFGVGLAGLGLLRRRRKA